MDIVFIRHGQGEHTLDIPESLRIHDPGLTEAGKRQVELLKNQFPLNSEDVVIASPVRRTLETALIWSNQARCRQIAHSLVSPRMFPQVNGAQTLPCDTLLPIKTIKRAFPRFEIKSSTSVNWENGINLTGDHQFEMIAREFIDWCKTLRREKVYVVSHDGTVTSYREIISGQKLTRDDFPKETGSYSLTIE